MSGFKDVVGHKELLQYIENAVNHQAVSHAYILSGEKGSGKRMLANLFSMALQCQNRGEKAEPCGSCQSCIQAKHGNHPDIKVITHEKPSSIGVDDIRDQVNADIVIKPYANPYKIYIIPDAELMTVQAQNALLKTMEEPPEYAVLMLLSSNAEALLPTIQSRCVKLKLRNLRNTLIHRYLVEQLDVEEEKADVCVAFAQGNMGKAIMLSESESFAALREEVVRVLTHIDTMDYHELFSYVKRATEYKISVDDYLDLIAIWYRDTLIYKATKNVDQVIFKDQLSHIRELARRSSYEGLEQVLDSIEKSKDRLRANVNFELTIELLFLSMLDVNRTYR